MRSGLSLVLGHFLSSPLLGQQNGSLPQDGKIATEDEHEFLCFHAGHKVIALGMK
jgi:hypothetical protein